MRDAEEIKVVLLSDSHIINRGICDILKESNHFTVKAVCTNIDQLFISVQRSKPNLIIVTPHMMPLQQKHIIEKQFVNLTIVACVYQYIEQSYLKSFDGIIDINDNLRKIENVLQSAHASRHTQGNDNSEEVEGLSEREKEVLIAIAKGLQNKEVANLLNISVNTAITHRRNIILKTGIKSVAGLTVYALMNNMIEESDII